MLKELTRFGEAEAAYRQALAQSPDDGDLHLQLGHLLKLLGRTEDAIDVYKRILAIDANNRFALISLG